MANLDTYDPKSEYPSVGVIEADHSKLGQVVLVYYNLTHRKVFWSTTIVKQKLD
jgi:hypothetical protein